MANVPFASRRLWKAANSALINATNTQRTVEIAKIALPNVLRSSEFILQEKVAVKSIGMGKRFNSSSSITAASTSNASSSSSNSSQHQKTESEPDPDEPPKKASIRERLRFLTRRYGWWALGVYLLASTVDFSLVFIGIHFLGADHIRDLEDRLRNAIGMGKRKMDDEEVAAWPVPVGVDFPSKLSKDPPLQSNTEAAKAAAQKLAKQGADKITPSHNNSGTLWTEAVLAYTIHKTLLLPFRVGITAAITPSFVKYMVRLGWARDNAAVRQAASKAKAAKAAKAAKKKTEAGS